MHKVMILVLILGLQLSCKKSKKTVSPAVTSSGDSKVEGDSKEGEKKKPSLRERLEELKEKERERKRKEAEKVPTKKPVLPTIDLPEVDVIEKDPNPAPVKKEETAAQKVTEKKKKQIIIKRKKEAPKKETGAPAPKPAPKEEKKVETPNVTVQPKKEKPEDKKETKIDEPSNEEEKKEEVLAEANCIMSFDTLLGENQNSEYIHLKLKNFVRKGYPEADGEIHYEMADNSGAIQKTKKITTGKVSFTMYEETQKLHLEFTPHNTPVIIPNELILASSVEFHVIRDDCLGNCSLDKDSDFGSEAGFYAFDSRDANYATQKIDSNAVCSFSKEATHYFKNDLF